MEELRFATDIEAIQYLSDITGKKIKVSSQSLKRYYSISRKNNGIVDFWIEKEFDNSWAWADDVMTALQSVKSEVMKVKSALSEFKITDQDSEGPSIGVDKNNKLGISMDSEIKFNTEEEMSKIISVLEGLEYDQYKR